MPEPDVEIAEALTKACPQRDSTPIDPPGALEHLSRDFRLLGEELRCARPTAKRAQGQLDALTLSADLDQLCPGPVDARTCASQSGVHLGKAGLPLDKAFNGIQPE